jgi:hypothetical protein
MRPACRTERRGSRSHAIYEPITIDDLARLAELAKADPDQLFARSRRLGER